MVAATLENALQKHRQGQLAEAGALYQQILIQDPKNLDAIRLLSVLHEQSGAIPKAIEFAYQMVALKPKQIEFYMHLANLLMAASETDEAISWLEKALRIDRRNLDVHLLLGDACQQKQAYTTALQHYQRALQLDRSVPDVYNNMGNAHLALNHIEEATTHYQKAISLKPDYVEAYFNLGNAQRQFGNAPEAIEAYQKALALDSKFYRAYTMLGLVAKHKSDYKEAENFYRQALALHPDEPSTMSNLSIVLAEQGQMDEALKVFDELAQKYPSHPDILSDVALTINVKGHFEKSMTIYEALARQNPNNTNHRINHALALPMIYDSLEDMETWRAQYEQSLDALLQRPLNPLPPHKVGAFSGASFYLAYHGRDDKALQCKLAQLFQRVLPMPSQETGQGGAATPAQKPNGKIQIGFLSGHLSPTHTIGKLILGIIAKLSREKFDIHIFSTPNKYAFGANLKMYPADQVNLLPYPSLSQSCEQVRAANLDILFFPDIGMDPFTYLLASYRLAPVQCVTWGHPITSGVSTIDYFISSKLLEPENAQEHYSEKLILLNSLPTYYAQPKLTETDAPRNEFGWKETDHIYLCPQSLYKIHPDFDAILAGVLRQDPEGILVLLDPGQEPTSNKLKQRFATTMPDVMDRIQFMPSCNRDKFLQLLSCADVMLDPVHFGGGNTTYEALALGVPIVTWPSAFMRGRVTAGCYQRMGMNDLIAHSAEEYIQLACRLGTEPTARAEIKAQILAQNAVLYEDTSVIEELEAFFLDALARQQGETTHG